MSPTPPSTNSSTGHSPVNDYRVVRKRNRVPLSCAPCRARKLKCNRSNPCENCVRRGDAAGCSYAAPVGPRRRSANSSSTSASGGDDMQSRIDRLEGLVLSLMTNGAQAPGLAAASRALERSGSNDTDAAGDEDVDEMIKEEDEDDLECADEKHGGAGEVERFTQIFGAMKVAKNEDKEGMYVGDSHWHMVLADIKEVRNFWKTFQASQREKNPTIAEPSQQPGARVALLYPTYPAITDADLRTALPPRSQIEALLSRFFDTLNPAVQVLHPPTFKSQIAQFFSDPTSHPTAWIALLYAVLSLAMQSYTPGVDEPSDWTGRTKDMEAMYRQRTVQAIVATSNDYGKIPAYTLEALILYLHNEYAARGDFDVSLWLVTGNVIRLAMRAGYHRDAAQFMEMDAFSCEMRRRVWLYLRKIDIIFSAQLALPGMIRSKDCDVQLPTNLFDEDFGPTGDPSLPLPPGRPDDVLTPVSHLRVKGRVCLLLGDIIDETQGLIAPKVPYSTIINFDNQLRAAADAIPPSFRVKSQEDSINDPPGLVLLQYHIDIILSKATCLLHRRFVSLGNKVQRYAYSRTRGVNAAMRLLELQVLIDRDFQKGGKLSTIHWDVGGMQRTDFLLGAMVVCLDMAFLPMKASHDLHAGRESSQSSASPASPGMEELRYTRDQQLEAVINCYNMIERDASRNMDAYKAIGVLKVMIEKLQKRQESEKLSRQPGAQFSNKFASQAQEGGEEHSAAMTLNMLSTGMTPNTALFGSRGGTGMTPGRDMQMAGGFEDGFAGEEALSPFSQMFGAGNSGTVGQMDVPDNVDWMAWDRYLQPTNPTGMDTEPYFATGYTPGPITDDVAQPPLQQDSNYAFPYNSYMGNDPRNGQ